MNEYDIKKFEDEKLLSSLQNIFSEEDLREPIILIHLIEIERRLLYAKRGFDNIFRMLIVYFKRSESSANRRLKAMQLLKDVPQAKANLAAGELNLMTLSMAQCQIRAQEKITGEQISIEQKIKIVEAIKNKTQVQAEIELFKHLPETASRPRAHIKRISENETRLGLNFPDELLAKLKRLKEIWSHVDPDMDYVAIINRCADETLKRVDPSRKTKKHRATTLNAQPVAGQRAKYFPVAVKSNLHQMAEQCCEYVDTISKRRCRSQFLLQIDHIVPIWAGGSNEPENLRILCATHNRLKYKLETNQLSDQTKDYRLVNHLVHN